jgi:hypothetical protein
MCCTLIYNLVAIRKVCFLCSLRGAKIEISGLFKKNYNLTDVRNRLKTVFFYTKRKNLDLFKNIFKRILFGS